MHYFFTKAKRRIFLYESPAGHDNFITRIGNVSDVGPTNCMKHINDISSTHSGKKEKRL